MSFLWICGMIPIDSLMYFAFGWYIGNIMPGPVGQKRPWNFPITITYWKQLFGAQCKQSENLVRSKEQDKHNEGYTHQRQNTCLPFIEDGVSLVSISKLYSNNLIAVKDLSFNFYNNEITSILGSNGAGKTTILSMLSSLYLPTSGKIFVNGRDMQTELMAIRKEIGVCPQYDVLFDYLTVKEHLMLFGALKIPSWTKNKLEREVEEALQEVGLLEHQKKLTCSLSGGMKRRLSVATAFIADAKTVILDEPTSGVDPCSQRFIWNILQKHRKDRTIIFTTHDMDEADYLSDRIVIIQQGRLKCYGSPSSFKEKYTQGYELILTKQAHFTNATQVTSLVQDCIPTVFLRENSSTQLVYEIPGKVDVMMFQNLFLKLDKNLHALHISGYGITNTTMEQVFLQLLQDGKRTLTQQTVLDVDIADYKSNNSNENNNCNYTVKSKKNMQRIQLYLLQISASLIYNFHHTRRDWKGSLANLVLPILFVTMAMGMFNLKPLSFDHPPLKLSSDLYSNEQALFFR
ncbi:glucosylceramide transporter ABCA12-like [Aquarana catesbeiana]|uniref:glucosylceramide transporter ABCA12-like n=1 Tax=Aquarana catesbeiana TaxID=8400 RepID=UPI003CC9B996